MLDWRIYYGDGSTFDSSMGEPRDVPALKGICILQRSEDGRGVTCICESHFYIHDGVAWVPIDKTGVWDRLISHDMPNTLIVGRMLRNEQYAAIVQRARKDPDFYAQFSGEEVAEFVRGNR